MALETHDTRSVITPAILSRRWGIGLSAAQKTLKVTMQKGVRNVLAHGERKVRQRLNHCLYPELHGKYYTDTMFAKIKSKRAHTSVQVFTNGSGLDYIYPIKSKSQANQGLMKFIHKAGIPQKPVSDGSKEQMESG
jgi:hypothetical protein